MKILSKINDFLEKDYKSSVLSGTMIISPYNFVAPAPDISTAWVAGGDNGGAYGDLSSMETYNGSAWVSGTALNAAQENGMSGGTKTACIIAGGYLASPAPYPNTNKCQTYNGSSWSIVGSLTNSRNNLANQGGGSTTNALCHGGHANGTGNVNVSEKWNGSSWSAITFISTWANYGGMYGGNGSSGVYVYGTSSFTWNGTASSSSGAVGTSHISGGGDGNSSNAFVQGGNGTGATDTFNGTTWSAGGSTTGRVGSAGGGNSTNGIILGGYNNSYTTIFNTTEQYYTNTWHSLPNLSTARGICFGGS